MPIESWSVFQIASRSALALAAVAVSFALAA